MDNKQAIKWLKYIKDMYSWNVNCDKSLDIAIKSLDDNTNDEWIEWIDKIRVEIEQDAFKDVNGSKYIFVNRVNQIIDKYRAESEE